MSQIGPANPLAPNSGFSDDDKVKDQLTYFYPKEDWKGEYGFDWFRLETCPDLEKLNDRGEKGDRNFENIGKYVHYLLRHCEIVVKYDADDPKGRVRMSLSPMITDNERGVSADIRSDSNTGGYNDYQKLIDNDVDLAHAFSKESFAIMKFYDRKNEIPVVYRQGNYGSEDFLCFDYQPSHNIGAKSVKFTFCPHRTDDVLAEDEYVRYLYKIEYERGKVKTLKIKRKHSYYEKTEELKEDGTPKYNYVDKEEERTFTSKGEVKKANEKETEEEKKRNKAKKKSKKKRKDAAPEEPQPYLKWDFDMGLIDRIFDNESIDKDSLNQDVRMDDVVVEADWKTLKVVYNDDFTATYEYVSGELVRLVLCSDDDDSTWNEVFFGTPAEIKKKIKKAGWKSRIEDKLLNDIFVDYDDDCLKKDVKRVEIEMEPAYGNIMTLTVEKEETPYTFQYGTKKPLSGLREEYKVKEISGEVYRKDGRFGYKKEEKRITFDEPIPLEPYWRDYMDGRYWTVKIGDQNIFYPHPTLALVDYKWRDKRRGLENDVVELKVKTFGEFDKIKFESTDTSIFDTKIGSGSTTKAEDTIKLKAKHPTVLIEDSLMAFENKKNEVTGCMNVHVFEPIHMKICFINVGFNAVSGDSMDIDGDSNVQIKNRRVVPASNANTGASKGWKPEDDEYLKILGQAGIIFDDIANESMQVEEYYHSVDEEGVDIKMTQSEFDLVSGADIPDYTDDHVSFKNKDFMRMWDGVIEWDDEFNEFVVKSTAAWDQMLSYYNSPAWSFDKLFLKHNKQYADYIRVYVLDKYMINNDEAETKKKKEDDENPSRTMFLSRYQLSCTLAYDVFYHCSLLMFKKSIEKTQSSKTNPLANALLRLMGLDNTFSNNAVLPYAYKTTTNVMDYNDYRYTLNSLQWQQMREGAQRMLEILADEKKFWEEYTEKPPTPNPTPDQTEASTPEAPAASTTEHPPMLHMKEREKDPNAESPKIELLDVEFKR